LFAYVPNQSMQSGEACQALSETCVNGF